jgi:hypothetical protein
MASHLPKPSYGEAFVDGACRQSRRGNKHLTFAAENLPNALRSFAELPVQQRPDGPVLSSCSLAMFIPGSPPHANGLP